MKNLPEKYLYKIRPEGLLSLDTRGLMEAICSGYQDVLLDARSYAGNLSNIIDSSIPYPTLPNEINVILATYTNEVGINVTRSLDIQRDTPDINDNAALFSWANAQLGLDPGNTLISVVAGTDLLRRVSIDTLALISKNLGAYIPPPTGNHVIDRDIKQKIIVSFFPRLQLKGTTTSFEQLLKIVGFDGVFVTPLWSRLASQSPQNNPAYSYKTEQTPYLENTELYTPTKYRDGPFYHYYSAPLSLDNTKASFYPSINGNNPFINVSILGTAPYHPNTGVYSLANGDANTYASALLGTNNILASAIAPGESFNGLKIQVTNISGTASSLAITDRLSQIKYRSNLMDLYTSINVFGTTPIQPNNNLLVNPSTTPDGTALTPFYPWSNGSYSRNTSYYPSISNGVYTKVSNRTQTDGFATQVDTSQYNSLLSNVNSAVESITPATRSFYNIAVGHNFTDTEIYSPYKASFNVNLNGSGSYSGTAITPTPPFNSNIEFEINNTKQQVYTELLDGTLYAANQYFSGYFNTLNNTYNFNASNSGNVIIKFYANGSNIIRPEPSLLDKQTGNLNFEARPESSLNSSGLNTLLGLGANYGFNAPILAKGIHLNANNYLPAEKDLELNCLKTPARIPTTQGTLKEIRVRDTNVEYPYPYIVLNSDTVSDITGEVTPNYSNTLYGVDKNNNLYNLLLIDSVAVIKEYWNDAKSKGIIDWVPLNDNKSDDIIPYSKSSVIDANLKYFNRVWDLDTGWNLNLYNEDFISAQNYSNLGNKYSLSFLFKTPVSQIYTPYTLLNVSNTLTINIDESFYYIYITSNRVPKLIGKVSYTQNQWNLFSISVNVDLVKIGINKTYTNFVSSNLDEINSLSYVINGGVNGISLLDFTIWNIVKTELDFNSLQGITPTKLTLPYPVPFVKSILGDNYYAFKITSFGFAYPDKHDFIPKIYNSDPLTSVSEYSPAAALRYDVEGLYQADPVFKQVGLGNGELLQPKYTLGLLGVNVQAKGLVVAGGTYPRPGGWVKSLGTSIVDNSNTISNPFSDRIYVSGQGGIYQVGISNLSGTPQLASYGTVPNSDSVTLLGIPGKELSVVNNIPTVISSPNTRTTSLVYLYNNTQRKLTVDNAFNNWVNNPNKYSLAYLSSNGSLNFLNATSLSKGNYNLSLSLGNLGYLDSEFSGYSTNISIINQSGISIFNNSYILFANNSGGDSPRGVEDIIISLPQDTGNSWILSITLNNYTYISFKDQGRKLTIYSYLLDLINPIPYSVGFDSNSNLALKPTPTYTTPNLSQNIIPGGVIASINSYGTVYRVDQESTIYHDNSVYPLSNLLTTSTHKRVDSLSITPTQYIDAPPTSPTKLQSFAITNPKPLFNYGDTLNLVGSAYPNPISYTYRFWDGDVQTVANGSYSKIVNQGNGSVSILATDDLGNFDSKTIIAKINNPNQFFLQASPQVGIYPFSGTVSAIGSFPNTTSFNWLSDSNSTVRSYGSYCSFNAINSSSIKCTAKDVLGGYSSGQVMILGQPYISPIVSPIESSSEVYQSLSRSLSFSCYGIDLNTGSNLNFLWKFWDNVVGGAYATAIDDNYNLLPGNSIDPHWSIDNSGTLTPAYVVQPSLGLLNNSITSGDGINNGNNITRPAGYYFFTTSIDLTGVSNVSISLKGYGLDYCFIYVNGVYADNYFYYQYSTVTLDSKNSSFLNGVNTITIAAFTDANSNLAFGISEMNATGTFIGTTSNNTNSNLKFNTVNKTIKGILTGYQNASVTVSDQNNKSTTKNTQIFVKAAIPTKIDSITIDSNGIVAGTSAKYTAIINTDQNNPSFYWNFVSPRAITLQGQEIEFQSLTTDTGVITGTLNIVDDNGNTDSSPIPYVALSNNAIPPLQISSPPGYYTTGINMSITAPKIPNIIIRYSLDGSEISKENNGIAYLGQFIIPPTSDGSPITFKCRAFASGYAPTPQIKATYYFLNPNSSSKNVSTYTATVSTFNYNNSSLITSIPGNTQTYTTPVISQFPEVSSGDDPTQPFYPNFYASGQIPVIILKSYVEVDKPI